MKNLETWTFDEGARYDDVENMYIEVVRQYTRHLRHVMPYIGGIRFQEVRQGEDASAKIISIRLCRRKRCCGC